MDIIYSTEARPLMPIKSFNLPPHKLLTDIRTPTWRAGTGLEIPPKSEILLTPPSPPPPPYHHHHHHPPPPPPPPPPPHPPIKCLQNMRKNKRLSKCCPIICVNTFISTMNCNHEPRTLTYTEEASVLTWLNNVHYKICSMLIRKSQYIRHQIATYSNFS